MEPASKTICTGIFALLLFILQRKAGIDRHAHAAGRVTDPVSSRDFSEICMRRVGSTGQGWRRYSDRCRYLRSVRTRSIRVVTRLRHVVFLGRAKDERIRRTSGVIL